MISLASSLKTTAQSSAAQPARGAAAEASGAAQAFPEALAAAAPAPAGEAIAETALLAELPGKPAPGTALPIVLRSGKTLPVLAGAMLPGSANEAGANDVQHDVGEAMPAEADGEATALPGNAVLPLAVPVQPALPAADGAAPSLPASASAAPTARKAPVGTPPKGSPNGQSALPPKPAPDQTPVAQAPAPSVTVHVAPPVEASANDQPATAPGKEPRLAKKDAPVTTDSLIAATPAKMAPQLPAPTVAPSNTPVDSLGHRAHVGGTPPSPAAALHDLTSVVDRLVAAREALAPATAAMTLQHGELGDLSLRFDQHRDGHLAVQLSASDPDAHRAIVAAVSDAGFRGTADGQPGSSQQPAQSQAQARGHSAERDSGNAGHGSATRHDQPHQRRPATHGHERPGDERSRAGVFA